MLQTAIRLLDGERGEGVNVEQGTVQGGRGWGIEQGHRHRQNSCHWMYLQSVRS